MAVADIAVTMGPRNKRRLTTSAVTLGAAFAIAVSALWFFGGLPFVHSADRAGSSTAVERVIILIPQRPGMAYGMTKQQMIERLGRPEKVAGQCLQYHEGIRNFVGGTFNAVRMCFYENQYQNWFVELNGKWRDAYSGTNAVIPPPTGP